MKVHFCNFKLPDIISETDQMDFIEKSHNFNDRNWRLTYDEVQKSVYFPEMISKINTFAKNCPDCKFAKYERKSIKIQNQNWNSKFQSLAEPGGG